MSYLAEVRDEVVTPGSGSVAASSLASHDVVVVTQSSWHEPPRIRHQVTRQFARFTRVFYVETPVRWLTSTRTTIEQVAPNITRVGLGNVLPLPRRLLYWNDRLWSAVNRRYLKTISGIPGLRPNALLVTFNFDFVEGMSSERFALRTYFCNDHFVSFARGERARRAVMQREARTAAEADFCLTVSTMLADELSHSNSRTMLLLPGHELQERMPEPRRPGPIRAGYMGYLDHRIRYDWLMEAVGAGIEVHLVGPVMGSPPALEQLRTMPGVRMYGPRVGEEMQDILLSLDVLLLPYATEGTGMIAVTAPNKLYTYLACAKPIVLSPMPHFLGMSEGLTYQAAGGSQFVQAIMRAHADDSDALRHRRLTVARANRWDVRGDDLRILFETELARRVVSRTQDR